MMLRLNLLLLLAVMACSMYLVNTQYESRRLFTELDRAQVEARRLETEHQRLQVEKRAQATPLRVETLAREKLQMRSTTPAITQYVTDDGSPVVMAITPAAVPSGGAAATGGRRQ